MNYKLHKRLLLLGLLPLLVNCTSYAPPKVNVVAACPKLPPLDKALSPVGYEDFLRPLTPQELTPTASTVR